MARKPVGRVFVFGGGGKPPLLWVGGQPYGPGTEGGRGSATWGTCPWGLGSAPGPVRGVGAPCAVDFCAARRRGPISLEKWGKEHQGERGSYGLRSFALDLTELSPGQFDPWTPNLWVLWPFGSGVLTGLTGLRPLPSRPYGPAHQLGGLGQFAEDC